MNKKQLIIPKGIRYISEWEDYRLEDYNFPHILNKVLTGCGFTEYCLVNSQNIVLVSPRKFLLENKEDQHPEEVYYVRNELGIGINYELDISKYHKEKKQKEISEEEIRERINRMKEGIREYCYKRLSEGKPKKILVTYDSFRHVKDTLQEMGIFQNYQVVIDEFQSIFIDSRFKSDTELELLGYLRDVQKLCFVSATPMLDKYLDMLDEFKDLPYIEFDWETEDPSRIIHPKLEIRFSSKSSNEEASRVVESYQKGKFESRLDPDTGGLIKSREATIFMNSVKNICQVIRTCRLHIDECNVLCARTSDNEKEVRKAFNEVLARDTEKLDKHPKVPKDYEVIGRIPGKGEPHKMFTFCTRTVYLGADFYSTNSRTFIFGDSNIDCLSIDISMDLEQILGRQRLDENPWKNSARLYIKTTKKDNFISKEEFNIFVEKKIRKSRALLDAYSNANSDDKPFIAEKYEFGAKHEYYKTDYVAVNKHSGSSLKPVFNNLVLVSELRTFEMQQIDYKDRFSVFNALKEEGFINRVDDLSEIVKSFESIGTTKDRLKYLVKFTTETPGITEQKINNFLAQIPSKYSDYYRLLGPDRIRANGYLEARLKKEWIKIHSETTMNDEMIEKIYSTFKIGEKYSKAKIKSTLKEIYSEFNFDKIAKASDLVDYFILKNTTVKVDGEWVRGFEILGKK